MASAISSTLPGRPAGAVSPPPVPAPPCGCQLSSDWCPLPANAVRGSFAPRTARDAVGAHRAEPGLHGLSTYTVPGGRMTSLLSTVDDGHRHPGQRRRALRGQGPAPGPAAAPDDRRPARGARLGAPLRGYRPADGLHPRPHRNRTRGTPWRLPGIRWTVPMSTVTPCGRTSPHRSSWPRTGWSWRRPNAGRVCGSPSRRASRATAPSRTSTSATTGCCDATTTTWTSPAASRPRSTSTPSRKRTGSGSRPGAAPASGSPSDVHYA